MNIILWILQVFLGLYFIMTGFNHFTLAMVPDMMAWMFDLSPGMHYLAGTLEILGGLGLILPGIFKIRTRLIPLAALGLMLLMVGAAVFHIPRGEFMQIGFNVGNFVLLGIIAYGRWKSHPIPERNQEPAEA